MSFYRQEVPEIIFDRFLVVVFATRVLQNDMFCQLVESPHDFPGELDPNNLGTGSRSPFSRLGNTYHSVNPV